jgi:uncharacterized protein (DUF1697 family)
MDDSLPSVKPSRATEGGCRPSFGNDASLRARKAVMLMNYLALLRGVNVGGKNKLPMKDLAAMFATAGCSDVQTFIQSGNVIFKATPRISAQIPISIAAQIAEAFGYKTPVMLRTTAELASVVLNNPFLKAGIAEDTLHVLFLADLPSPQGVESLDPRRSPPDEFVVRGKEVYVNCPQGVGKSKLTNAYFDSKLATICTGRNWRTVTTLLKLMED